MAKNQSMYVQTVTKTREVDVGKFIDTFIDYVAMRAVLTFRTKDGLSMATEILVENLQFNKRFEWLHVSRYWLKELDILSESDIEELLGEIVIAFTREGR